MASLNEYLQGRKPLGFVCLTQYFADGDFASLFLEDVPYFAERVDELLTLYRAMDDHRFVGCKIKGVRRIMEEMGEFEVSVYDSDKNVLLGPLVFGSMALAQSPSLED